MGAREGDIKYIEAYLESNPSLVSARDIEEERDWDGECDRKSMRKIENNPQLL